MPTGLDCIARYLCSTLLFCIVPRAGRAASGSAICFSPRRLTRQLEEYNPLPMVLHVLPDAWEAPQCWEIQLTADAMAAARTRRFLRLLVLVVRDGGSMPLVYSGLLWSNVLD